ncbi:MAG: hypothetical protein QOD07_613 [Frankiaceae bacterium]|jgi:hypothetical protein|nr:hypothetical protein [Frankiaceae bacterium]
MSRKTLALALAGSVTLGFAVAGANAATSPKPAMTFSHEVVVDEQRAGFEPDIAIDNAGRLYSTVPNGSSEAHSFIWQSVDHGNSFQMIPGQLGLGKPATCPQGGGDTETQIDKKGDIFFSDLQNLSNLSNSVSTDHGATWKTNCLSVPNSPVDRMWYAIHGNLGDPDFAIYEEYDAAASGTNPNDPNAPTNQLVESVSHDGITFTPVFNGNLLDGKVDDNCIGGGQLNCVTDNEGISGNQVLAPNGDLLIAHTTEDSNQVVVSRGKLTMEPGGQVVAHWTHTVVNASLCPDKPSAPGICGASNFATIAEDSAGHFYVAFSSQQNNASGNPIGPYLTYVVASKDGSHWGKPMLVSKGGSNAFSWVNAGSSGRVAVAWYHADETSENGHYLLDDLTHAEISVQVGESLDALSAHPHWTVTTVSEHPIKYGPICTQGLNCTISMGDRSLGDYLEVNHDAQGALLLSYVDDTSNTYTTGPTGAVAENGPTVVVRQTSGPSLIAGTIHGAGSGPGAPYDGVSDPAGDAYYNANTQHTSAGANLDLTSARIRQDKNGLVVTMTAKSLSSLLVSPTAGGTTGEWIARFTTYDPHTPGNGHIYYAGMESVGGAAPRFFGGDVAPTPGTGTEISMLFDSNTTIPGAVQGNTITLHVPWSMIGGHKVGRVLYSATAFSASAAGTLAKNPVGLFNLTDATPPFDYVVKK